METKSGFMEYVKVPDGEQIKGITVWNDILIVATCSGVYKLEDDRFTPIKFVKPEGFDI